MTTINNIDSSPLVSIICRTVDRPSLTQALDSVFSQTWPNIELVVVDARGQGLQSPATPVRDITVKVVSTGNPLNRPAAANAGLDHASGDWLLFLDDDDWIAPEHIQILMSALKDRPGLVAYSDTQVTDPDGHATDKVFAHAFDPVLLKRDNYLPIHSVLFSRSLIDSGCRFDETLAIYEDWDFWQQCARHGDFLHVESVTAFYRQGGDSATALEQEQEQDKYKSGTPQARARIDVLNKWLPYWRGEELNSLLVSSVDYSNIKAELAACVQHIRNLEQENTNVAGQLHQARVQQQSADAEYHKVLEQLQTAQNQFAQLQAQHTELQAHHEELQAHYTELNRQLTYVKNSLSWRATRPFRWLGRHLKRIGGHRTDE
ncbi:glycosyltransferase [Pseudohongiella acticola]|jgi:glycosyltransferase involved in cell wall biosynthesis|uniref:glycosyltransferase n=1 Tax=Pseudohongiella acticola TaxID=1524254 RepID=UPI0030EB95E4